MATALSRRALARLAGVSTAAFLLNQGRVRVAQAAAYPRGTSYPTRTAPPTPIGVGGAAMDGAVLTELLAGNERYQSDRGRTRRWTVDESGARPPRALIISCTDATVPSELLFDEASLSVVRTAGNIVTGGGPLLEATIDYAVAVLNVPLVMVLGHSDCGAIRSALQSLESGVPLPSAARALAALIEPAAAFSRDHVGDFVDNAVRKNIEDGVLALRSLTEALAERVETGAIQIVGALLDDTSGKVEMAA